MPDYVKITTINPVVNHFATVKPWEPQTGCLTVRLWMFLAVLFAFHTACDGSLFIGTQAPGKFEHSTRLTWKYRYDGIALFAPLTVMWGIVMFLKEVSYKNLIKSKLTGIPLNTTATMRHDSRSFHWNNSPKKTKNIVFRAMEYSYDDACHEIRQSNKNSTIRRKKQAK